MNIFDAIIHNRILIAGVLGWATAQVLKLLIHLIVNRKLSWERLIGDGGMAFFLKDLIVAPEYQGKGVGRELMCHIEDYIRGELEDGWECRFQLISAKDKEEFYRKCGYIAHPHEHSGPGFTKLIRK